ncbi:unnamed protein product [Rotaria sp. Silwood1]|nr:unnamed protein product [Rotaria sp. Silwood1]
MKTSTTATETSISSIDDITITVTTTTSTAATTTTTIENETSTIDDTTVTSKTPASTTDSSTTMTQTSTSMAATTTVAEITSSITITSRTETTTTSTEGNTFIMEIASRADAITPTITETVMTTHETSNSITITGAMTHEAKTSTNDNNTTYETITSAIEGLPPFLDVQSGTIYGVWNTFAGGISTLATENSTGAGTYYTGQPPDNLFDGSLNTKYTSRGNSTSGTNAYAGLNTGFYLSIIQCQPVLIGFRFGNAYNFSEREPLMLTIEGTNCANLTTCVNWTLIYNGSTGLDTATSSLAYGQYQSISNSNSYKTYRFLITDKRDLSAYVSYSEVQLFGYSNQSSTSQNGTSSRFIYFDFIFEINHFDSHIIIKVIEQK